MKQWLEKWSWQCLHNNSLQILMELQQRGEDRGRPSDLLDLGACEHTCSLQRLSSNGLSGLMHFNVPFLGVWEYLTITLLYQEGEEFHIILEQWFSSWGNFALKKTSDKVLKHSWLSQEREGSFQGADTGDARNTLESTRQPLTTKNYPGQMSLMLNVRDPSLEDAKVFCSNNLAKPYQLQEVNIILPTSLLTWGWQPASVKSECDKAEYVSKIA